MLSRYFIETKDNRRQNSENSVTQWQCGFIIKFVNLRHQLTQLFGRRSQLALFIEPHSSANCRLNTNGIDTDFKLYAN